MAYTGEFAVFEDIIQEMALVYQYDNRPWMIGFSGGKDSTMLCCLDLQMLQRLPAEKRNKVVPAEKNGYYCQRKIKHENQEELK